MKRLALLAFAVLLACAPGVAYGLPGTTGDVRTSVTEYGEHDISYGASGATRIAISNSTDGLIATFRELNGAPIYASDGCSGSGTSVVTCVSAVPFELLSVSGSTGNDYIDIRGWHPFGAPFDTDVHPGLGNDVMLGSPGDDQFEGDFGADLAYGYAGDDGLAGDNGADTLYGGDGDDSLSSGKGPLDALWLDHLYCGAGYDTFHAPSPDVAVGCEVRR
jgi:Ca2+-binding RTX toxin-like protein